MLGAAAAASVVEVSAVPLPSTSPTTRGTRVGSVAVRVIPPGPVVPGAAAYPVRAMKRPSAEREIRPSDGTGRSRSRQVAVGGRGGQRERLDRVPSAANSSRKTGAAALVSAARRADPVDDEVAPGEACGLGRRRQQGKHGGGEPLP